jgi:hypothetical protein
MYAILLLSLIVLLETGCARIELRSLIDPQINMVEYRSFTVVNQSKPGKANYLRDKVLLEHASNVMAEMGYTAVLPATAQAHVTLVFNEGFKQVFVPPYTQPIISYTHGEFTSVTGTINGETVRLFGYIPPRRIERYVEIPGHEIDVYKLMLRIDIYDARTLSMVWTGTAYTESSPGNAIRDAKIMTDKLLKERLPDLKS